MTQLQSYVHRASADQLRPFYVYDGARGIIKLVAKCAAEEDAELLAAALNATRALAVEGCAAPASVLEALPEIVAWAEDVYEAYVGWQLARTPGHTDTYLHAAQKLSTAIFRGKHLLPERHRADPVRSSAIGLETLIGSGSPA